MKSKFDPRGIPLSRMLSDYSIEENRPGFFNLSTTSDVLTSRDDLNGQTLPRERTSQLNKTPSTEDLSIVSPTSTNTSIRPKKNLMTHNANPRITVTDWTDPLQASDEQTNAVQTTSSKEPNESSNSKAEQGMEYDGKPPVFLNSQVNTTQPEDAKVKGPFMRQTFVYVKKSIQNSLTPSAFRSFIRCLSAFAIVSFLLLIPSTAKWIGPVDILTCSGLIFFPPNKTLGAQLEASVLGVLFILISGVYSYAGLACLVAYNSRQNPQTYGAPLITAVFIIFSTLLLGYLRTKYTRLYTPCVAAQVTLFFALFLNIRITELNFSVVWSINKPLLLSVAITFTCSLVIFPQSATGKLANETQNALKLTNDLLQETVKTFLFTADEAKLPEELEVTRLHLRSSLGALNSVGREAMYELSVGRFAPWDYKWIGSTITTVGQILGSMLLLVFKEHTVLSQDLPRSPSNSLYRNETLIIHVGHHREFSISNDQIYKALLNTVQDPITRITHICSRAIKHIQLQFRTTNTKPQSQSSMTNSNERSNQANVNIPLVDNFETTDIIEELEHGIAEIETTEVLCSRILSEMGLDTKPRDELFIVFTFLFCTREISRKLLKLARYQKGLSKLRRSAKRIWWPTVGIFTLLSAPRYDDLIQVSEKDIDLVDQDNYSPAPDAKIHHHFRYHLWLFLMWFQKPEFKFSVKFTLALCLTAIPAFVSSIYDWFLQVHGNWGLVTVCVVMNQTVGSTLSIGFYRIVGTILGGFWGYLGWLASQGNPYIIAVFTYIIAIPCWYFFITKPQTKIHSVSLITYIVIIFSMYNSVVIQKQAINSSALLLAVLRTANLIAAIVVSLLVETLLWPYVARVELRKHLGRTFYSLGVLFSKVISIYMTDKDTPASLEAKHDVKRMTSKLQSAITKATALLVPAAQEPKLRDNFRKQTYIDIITKVQNLLDWSSTMCASIVQIDNDLKRILASRSIKKRKDVIAAVLLHFYVISGAFKSKSPLPPYLPSARVARLRLLNKIRKVDTFQNLGSRACMARTDDGNNRFIYTFWYAYAGSLIEIVEEQEELGDLVKQVVGEIEFAVSDLNSNSERTPTTSVDIERMADAAGLSVPKNSR